MWDVLSGVAKMAWDVMSGVTKAAWDVMSGVTKTAWDVLSGPANFCGMFCPGCQKIKFFKKVKFILISIPTIYLSYSYNPVATNTNLRAVTLVYPCSGLNIDSNDITEYRN